MLGDSGGGGESEEDLVEVKGTDPLFSAMAERAGGSEGDGEGEGEGEQAGAMDPSASLGSLVRQLEQTLPGDWNPTSSSPVPTTDHPLAFEPSSPPRYDKHLLSSVSPGRLLALRLGNPWCCCRQHHRTRQRERTKRYGSGNPFVAIGNGVARVEGEATRPPPGSPSAEEGA